MDRPLKLYAGSWNLARRLFLVAAIASLAMAQQAPEPRNYQSPPETLPRRVPGQPVRFSHKAHAAQGIDCIRCHPDSAKKFEAGLPTPRDCMGCHRTVARDNTSIQKLVQLIAADVRIDWIPVYDSPSYVIFSHRKHVRAGETCQTCHGDVTQYDALPQEVSISMTSCMNCHTQRGVENECFWCHELNGF
ncbi:MAG: cytochrome c3 family protein [Acidobacteria bacterium]|nr:cytochrome c3 family protein [Acidobacteriota bacterium]MDA1233328.1 cytochrome c3 family protein [Acidobacteriota bacterium]